MRKLLNKPWFVALLALGAIAAVGQSVLSHRGNGYVPPTSADNDPAVASGEDPAAAPSDDTTRIRAALKEVAAIKPARDPFFARPKSTGNEAAKPEPDLTDTVRVSAVWIQGAATYALINDRICQVGDQVGRLTIDAVTADGVWLRHWKGRNFVGIGGDFTLTTPVRHAAALLSSQG